MIKALRLDSRLEPVPKTSPAAKNRFIYAHKKLHMLPTSLAGALTHPLLAAKLPRAGLDLIKGGSGQEDESIESFVNRRFGKGFSDDLISAMVHGIYAGDLSKLSVRSTFGILYHLEKDYGSVILGMLMGGGAVETPWDRTLKENIMAKMPELKTFVDKTSIYSFTDGLEDLSKALEQDLVESGRVNIRKESWVEKLISIKDHDPIQANTVIAALPPSKLSHLLPVAPPELIYNPSVTVAVVNLVYNADQARLASPGFGYLIPRSENSAVRHRGLLGVVFDSCAIPTQDKGPSRDHTLKLTAMIGGHMFEDVAAHHEYKSSPSQSSPSQSITQHDSKAREKELTSFFKEVATDAVKRHLQIDASPEIVKVHIQHDCIPQYLVGHLQRMQTLDRSLRKEYDGLLAVTGAGYLGVSINDCIKNAREVAESVMSKLEEEDDGEAALVGRQDAVTGLERAWFL
ncbi:hypothetical protein BGZ65_002519 [Modicella reniformis]|uniref:Protoporphyrinogen oxidase n=1 Tax=Modicella reniformis TaxID=1440133 RepID=A0A9P6J2N2_9FUNG|nr:hypothetical protein BGZ65_002519 [Modicella reniformis]